jgi:tripartite-type tricarboxylate transporter receptor subunit TctC
MKTFAWTCAGLVLATLTTLATPVMAAFPDRPLRLVVPYPPGATNDKLGRALAERLSRELGQPVVVDNKAGASTAIGAVAVATAPADGYTLLLGTTTTYAVNPLVRTDLPYAPERDFKTVQIVAETPEVLLVNTKSPFKTLQDVIDYAKAHPGQLMYSSSGAGTSLHLAAEGFAARAGVKLKHIPYQGSAPAMFALLKGEVQMMSEVSSGAVAQAKAGQVRVLAVGSAQRMKLLPDVPTFIESGYPGFRVAGWYALSVPRATPDTVVEKLRSAIDKVLVDPTLVSTFQADGMDITPPRDGAGVQAYMDAEKVLWTDIVKTVTARGGLEQ